MSEFETNPDVADDALAPQTSAGTEPTSSLSRRVTRFVADPKKMFGVFFEPHAGDRYCGIGSRLSLHLRPGSAAGRRSRAVQLRGQYAEIATLITQSDNSTGGPTGVELDVALAVAVDNLRRLGGSATGADYEFLADAYRQDSHPDVAIPLYGRALEETSDNYNRITIHRGIAYAEATLDNPRAVNQNMREAIVLSDKGPYQPVIRRNNNSNTQRVWIVTDVTMHLCREAAAHLARFIHLNRTLPPGLQDNQTTVTFYRTTVHECES